MTVAEYCGGDRLKGGQVHHKGIDSINHKIMQCISG